MGLRLLAVLILTLAMAGTPGLLGVGSAAMAQTDLGQISLVPSSNSTSFGGTVNFTGAVSGVNSTLVTFMVIGPDGSSENGTVPISGTAYSFSYSFNVSGDWTVFAMAGDLSNPEAISDPVAVTVLGAPPPSYLGIPVIWLGVAILVISAASLVYLVYAIKGREEAEAESKAKGGSREGNGKATPRSKP